jgi:hypothetical protein
MERSDHADRLLVPKFVESENSVEISIPWNSDVKFRAPMPSDWKTTDTIRAALEKAKR